MTAPDNAAASPPSATKVQPGQVIGGVQQILAGADELVRNHDVVGTLTRLLQLSCEAVGAASAGLLVRRLGHDDLELLATTNHAAGELELNQLQAQQGPCIDTAYRGTAVHVADLDQLRERWPDLVGPFRAAGYHAARATPMVWRPDTIGALNVFWADPHPADPEEDTVLQTFAHLATLALTGAHEMTPTKLVERTRTALDERIVIEQAKGALCYQHGIDTDQAMALLQRLAAADGRSVTSLARTVIASAQQQLPTAPIEGTGRS